MGSEKENQLKGELRVNWYVWSVKAVARALSVWHFLDGPRWIKSAYSLDKRRASAAAAPQQQ
jgi:hypothetical protein